MGRRQFIFLCECDGRCQSDYLYISRSLRYAYDLAGNKLSPVFLAGKGNYDKKAKEILRLKKKYQGESLVFVAIDLDKDNNENKEKNKKVEDYCKKNGYHFIWFHLDVEDVFLGKTVPQEEKGKKAKSYDPRKTPFDEKNLKSTDRKRHASNLFAVMDEFLSPQKN